MKIILLGRGGRRTDRGGGAKTEDKYAWKKIKGKTTTFCFTIMFYGDVIVIGQFLGCYSM